jgi:hypothetical protein
MSPNWRSANSYGILPAAVQPGSHLLLNNLNIVDPKILWNPLSTLYFLDSWGSLQSKEGIITGADPGQPSKSHLTVRTAETNWRTSEHLYVIAPIGAPLKSAAWRSKFVIFHTCPTFFWIFLVAFCRFCGLGPFPPCLIGGFHNTSRWNYSRALDLHFKFEQPYLHMYVSADPSKISITI